MHHGYHRDSRLRSRSPSLVNYVDHGIDECQILECAKGFPWTFWVAVTLGHFINAGECQAIEVRLVPDPENVRLIVKVFPESPAVVGRERSPYLLSPLPP